MAQWIPKTAWKVSNLNKRYGVQYMQGGYGPQVEPVLSAYSAAGTTQSRVAQDLLMAALDSCAASASSDVFVMDLRDAAARRYAPLSSSAISPLHPHDVLSGAVLPLLPRNRDTARIFLITDTEDHHSNPHGGTEKTSASTSARAINVSAALRRWGYQDIIPVEGSAVALRLQALATAARQ